MNSPTLAKLEEHPEHSSGSVGSTPEADAIDHENEHAPHAQEPGQQQQKRKGGRKPIYATSEERKQRNRQAQAAFRERRTEYIKHLENTIKIHEDNLQSLQQSHRSAADECLMLRYKNSLLERILLEKGIDVQAELRAKGGSPNLGPTRAPISAAPLSQPIQRYAVNKYAQNRRSLTSLPTKDGTSPTQVTNISPHLQPSPASRISSPTTSTHRSPNFVPQNGPMSPSFGAAGQQTRPQQTLRPHFHHAASTRPPLATPSYPSSASTLNSAISANSSAGASVNQNPNAFYAAQFQNHYEQLEQEYEQAQDMYDDDGGSHQTEHHQPSSAGAYSSGFSLAQGVAQHQLQAQAAPPHMTPDGANQAAHTPAMLPQAAALQQADASGGFGAHVHQAAYEQYDPMLDADPFGLSASMHFPTQFSFGEASR